MKKFVFIALALLTIGSALASGDGKGAEAAKSLATYRADIIKAARESGKTEEIRAALAKVEAKAIELTAGVDPATVSPEDAFDWAQVFQSAKKLPESKLLAIKSITAAKTPSAKFDSQFLAFSLSLNTDDVKGAAAIAKDVQPSELAQGLKFASYLGNYAGDLAQANSANEIIDLIHRTAGTLTGEPKDDNQKAAIGRAKAGLATGEAEILKSAGKPKEAIAVLDQALAAADGPAKRSLTSARTQLVLIGQPAPSFETQKTIGGFKSLEALKGKVVIVDFFAHWCPPCKAELPEFRKLNDQFGDKGLAIVGYTKFYGYYRAERNITQDVEFAKEHEFISEFNINWPVVYTNDAAFTSVGITGIPTTLLIDKKGNIRQIEVGYSPEGFAKFRKQVEALLAE